MRIIKLVLVFAFLHLAASCSSDSGSDQFNEGPILNFALAESPFELQGVMANFAPNIAYGDEERNLFNIWMPDSDTPTPLAIWIHGGGFTGGNKDIEEGPGADTVRALLSRGIAVASISYYLLTVDPPDTNGVLKSLNDSKRALQFMRYHANSLNIDPENVALYGGSAGAGTALWLGTHDDMAEPNSSDPIARESSRVKAVGALATQATYDVIRWEEVLLDALLPFAGVLGGTDIVSVSRAVGTTNLLLAFLAIDSVDEIEMPDVVARRQSLDMLGLMDSSDAPIFVANTTPDPSNLIDLLFHHGLHGRALKEAADAAGLENVVYVDDSNFSIQDPSGEDLVSFLSRHIN